MPRVSNHEAAALQHQSRLKMDGAAGNITAPSFFTWGVASGDQNFTVIPE
jgi:hypothetical protein